jgi:opacity protein-like surface antigen
MKKMTLALLGSTLAVGLALAGGSAYAADLMAPPPAEAVVATSGGGYISVFGGYALATTLSGVSTQSTFNLSVPLGSGYIVGGAVGTHLGDNLRIEGELSYVSHSATGTIFASGNGAGTVTGNTGTAYLLGNLWADLDTGSGFTPYVGGGLGLAAIMPNMTIDSGGTYTTTAFAPAAQLGAGVKFNVGDNMSVDFGYRAKYVFNATIVGGGTLPNIASTITGASYLDQSVQIGLNFGF